MRTKGCHWLQPSSLRTAWAILGVALSNEACWAGLRLRLAVLMCCWSLASRSLLTVARFCFKPVCSINTLRDSGLAGAAWAVRVTVARPVSTRMAKVLWSWFIAVWMQISFTFIYHQYAGLLRTCF